MDEKNFISEYLKDLSSLIQPNETLINKMIEVKKILLQTRKDNSKTMIFGNGGSGYL